MKIALAQLNYTIGDIEGNTRKIVDAIKKPKTKVPMWSSLPSRQ